MKLRPLIAAIIGAALAMAAAPIAIAANQVPYIGTNLGPQTYSAPGAIIIPSVAATPGGAGCTVGSTGCTLPVSGTITIIPGGTQHVDGTGAAGTPAAGVVTVQGVTGGTAVTVQALGAASANGSTTVTLGGTFQTVLASSATRQGCTVQNPTTATEPLYVNFGVLGSATTANSFSLAPGGALNCTAGLSVATDAVNVTATTTSHPFVLLSR